MKKGFFIWRSCFILMNSFFLVISSIYALTVGSDSAVAVEPFINFPQSDPRGGPNRMYGFGWFQNGFGLQNSLTTCEYNAVFPVSGLINMNGGTLTLTRDLIFTNSTTIRTWGDIIGNNHTLELSSNIRALPGGSFLFDTTRLVLNNDLVLNDVLSFAGDVIIVAQGHTIRLSLGGALVVENCSLTVQNGTIAGVNGRNLLGAGKLILEDSKLVLDEDAQFTMDGGLECRGSDHIAGDYIFSYRSIGQLLVHDDSQLILDEGLLFNYAPSNRNPALLKFESDSAELVFNGCTFFVNVPACQLTKGRLQVWQDSLIQTAFSGVGQGLFIGDGVDARADFLCVLRDGLLRLNAGALNYRNVDINSWQSTALAQIVLACDLGTIFRIYNSLNLNSGITFLANNSILERYNGARILSSVQVGFR